MTTSRGLSLCLGLAGIVAFAEPTMGHHVSPASASGDRWHAAGVANVGDQSRSEPGPKQVPAVEA
jgi:hypothetical protein